MWHQSSLLLIFVRAAAAHNVIHKLFYKLLLIAIEVHMAERTLDV